MMWIILIAVILCSLLIRIIFMKYGNDLQFQWLILSGKDDSKIKELVRRRNKQLDEDAMARFFTHSHLRFYKGRIYLPMSLYFFTGYPIFRFFPMFIMWFFLNLQYKWKLKGRGLLWPVPKTILINEYMNDETVPKDY